MRKTGVPKKRHPFFLLLTFLRRRFSGSHGHQWSRWISETKGAIRWLEPEHFADEIRNSSLFVDPDAPPILSLSQIEGQIGCGVVAIDDCLPPMLPAGSRIPNPV